MHKKLENWAFRTLNTTGRLVLLKEVLQSMPLYLFSALAAPKSILKESGTSKEILCGAGAHKENKWALVAWDKLCLPKLQGGLGLKDPESLNAVLGAKTWWRWITEGNTPWAHLWHKKYFPQVERQGLIRLTGDIPGSHIWNAAWANKHLVHSQCFWEIRNGRSTLFWEDSWKKLPPLSQNDNLGQLRDLMTAQNKSGSINTGFPPNPGDIWRTWIPKEDWIPHQPIPNWDPFGKNSHTGKSEFNKAKIN
jgi:hypothetical protein